MASKKTSPALVLTVLSVMLIVAFGALWWRQVYTDPQRVFEAMLNNSLRLKSVFKEVNTTTFSQEVQQDVYLRFEANDLVVSKTHLVQLGEARTVVETESVGTPTTDYVRYTGIDTEQTKANGDRLDFSSVLNVWGRSGGEQNNNLTTGELYNETILGIVPFGVLDRSDRRELLKLIKTENVYEVDYGSVNRATQNGRPLNTYAVTVDAEAYIKQLKRFGELKGLNHLSQLDSAAYAGQERLPFTITVDVWSRQLQRIEYSSGERTETFSGHNGLHPINLPEQTITVEELQTRLQELQ